MTRFFATFLALLLAAGSSVMAQQVAFRGQSDAAVEPDSIQISWTTPCDGGGWLFDTETGCRMWDWHPEPGDKAVWTGALRDGRKNGPGVVQWTEHGRKIDRFEGSYRFDRREGFGRYVWNNDYRFEGNYADDVPDGYGTVYLAGQTLSGQWHNGCLTVEGRVVAIGVPRTSCTAGEDRPIRSAQR